MDKSQRKWSLITGRKSIPIIMLSIYFLFLLGIFNLKEPMTFGKLKVSLGYSILWLIMTTISLLELPSIKAFWQKYSAWMNAFALLLSPALSFLITELMMGNFNPSMFKTYGIYNMIWYYVVYFLIYAVIRNARNTVMLGCFFIYTISVLNYFVYLFRGNPLIPSDLLAWRTGMSVASNYEISFTKEYLLATVLMYGLFTLGYGLSSKKQKPGLINRSIGLAVCSLGVFMVFYLFFETDLIKTKIRVLDYFAPKYTYSTYGTAFGFVANVKALDAEPPKDYSAEEVGKVLEEVHQEKTTAIHKKPNIIAIMNEAFSDLSLIGDYKTNMDYLPFIRSMKEDTVKGNLYVSVFGGATSNTEYEFLTGNSMAVMPKNSVPYQQFVTDTTDSLAATLKSQGYHNIAIHPYKRTGYKRDIVYPLLGFDEFLSMEDFNQPELIRSYISDRESYRKIIEQYEDRKDEGPLFIFNVTMQNHGGYSSDRIFSDEDTVTLTEASGYEAVEQYLSLLRESDKAFQGLVDYFEGQEEPTILLLFGDHQPVAYSQFHDSMENQPEKYRTKYMVPFVLWTNYDISEETVDKISANYLSAYLLETAGLEKTTYQEYLLNLHDTLPVITGQFYIDQSDQLHGLSDATLYSELMKEYQWVGYNNALDHKDKLMKYYFLTKGKSKGIK